MRYHIFLQYGWFLQNLEKGCIRTNMHTTVHKKSYELTVLIYTLCLHCNTVCLPEFGHQYMYVVLRVLYDLIQPRLDFEILAFWHYGTKIFMKLDLRDLQIHLLFYCRCFRKYLVKSQVVKHFECDLIKDFNPICVLSRF